MLVFDSLDAIPGSLPKTGVTIGKFDGVHRGHRRILDELKRQCAARGLLATVLTFDRNPLSLLHPELCPNPLVSNAQKRELFEEARVDAAVFATFDRAFSERSPEAFVQEILVDTLHAALVYVGPDFRFGRNGAGTVSLLEELGRGAGFEVTIIDAVTSGEGVRISSTRVRDLLTDGRVREAAALLGRNPSVRAIVVAGEGRGRQLGVPTANLAEASEGFIPADGVYAAWLTVDGERMPAAVSVGNNPTFSGVPQKQVEAHVIGRDIDLYGKQVDVAFVDRVRDMQKFDQVSELIDQMAADVRQVADLLAGTGSSAADS